MRRNFTNYYYSCYSILDHQRILISFLFFNLLPLSSFFLCPHHIIQPLLYLSKTSLNIFLQFYILYSIGLMSVFASHLQPSSQKKHTNKIFHLLNFPPFFVPWLFFEPTQSHKFIPIHKNLFLKTSHS